MHSATYQGKVRHRRFRPVENIFEYRLFMMYIDLAELDRIFQKRWFWSVDRPNLAYLRRRDHLGDPGNSIDNSVRCLIRQDTEFYPSGPINSVLLL